MIAHIREAKRYKAVAVDEMHRYGTSNTSAEIPLASTWLSLKKKKKTLCSRNLVTTRT